VSKYSQNLAKGSIVLSKEEETSYFKLIKKGGEQGKKARDEFIANNIRLVQSEVKKFYKNNQGNNGYIEYDDLLMEGIKGLLKAIDSFDYTLGNKFSTYAVPYIDKYIRNFINDNKFAFELSSSAYDTIAKINKAKNELTLKLKKEPTSNEISKYLNIKGLTPEKVDFYLDLAYEHVSFDESISQDSNSKLLDMIPDKSLEKNDNEEDEDLDSLLACLTPREKDIIKMYYLDGDKSNSYQIIANKYQISRERVRQIINSSIEKIRKNHPELYEN